MAGILEYLPQLNKRAWKFILILVAVVLLIIAIHYVWKNYVSPKLNPTYVANKEFTGTGAEGDDSNVAYLKMFVVDWCPYCKKAIPVWDKFQKEYEGRKINGYTLYFRTINCTDENDAEVKDLLNRYNIDGYPTIKLIKDGEPISFDAKPEFETLQQFLQTVLSN